MKVGDRVRIVLKEVTDGIDASIQGREGILESNNLDPYVPYDFCIRIGGFIFGMNIAELELVESDDQTTTDSQ